jgi:transcription termination factor NusB
MQAEFEKFEEEHNFSSVLLTETITSKGKLLDFMYTWAKQGNYKFPKQIEEQMIDIISVYGDGQVFSLYNKMAKEANVLPEMVEELFKKVDLRSLVVKLKTMIPNKQKVQDKIVKKVVEIAKERKGEISSAVKELALDELETVAKKILQVFLVAVPMVSSIFLDRVGPVVTMASAVLSGVVGSTEKLTQIKDIATVGQLDLASVIMPLLSGVAGSIIRTSVVSFYKIKYNKKIALLEGKTGIKAVKKEASFISSLVVRVLSILGLSSLIIMGEAPKIIQQMITMWNYMAKSIRYTEVEVEEQTVAFNPERQRLVPFGTLSEEEVESLEGTLTGFALDTTGYSVVRVSDKTNPPEGDFIAISKFDRDLAVKHAQEVSFSYRGKTYYKDDICEANFPAHTIKPDDGEAYCPFEEATKAYERARDQYREESLSCDENFVITHYLIPEYSLAQMISKSVASFVEKFKLWFKQIPKTGLFIGGGVFLVILVGVVCFAVHMNKQKYRKRKEARFTEAKLEELERYYEGKLIPTKFLEGKRNHGMTKGDRMRKARERVNGIPIEIIQRRDKLRKDFDDLFDNGIYDATNGFYEYYPGDGPDFIYLPASDPRIKAIFRQRDKARKELIECEREAEEHYNKKNRKGRKKKRKYKHKRREMRSLESMPRRWEHRYNYRYPEGLTVSKHLRDELVGIGVDESEFQQDGDVFNVSDELACEILNTFDSDDSDEELQSFSDSSEQEPNKKQEKKKNKEPKILKRFSCRKCSQSFKSKKKLKQHLKKNRSHLLVSKVEDKKTSGKKEAKSARTTWDADKLKDYVFPIYIDDREASTGKSVSGTLIKVKFGEVTYYMVKCHHVLRAQGGADEHNYIIVGNSRYYLGKFMSEFTFQTELDQAFLPVDKMKVNIPIKAFRYQKIDPLSVSGATLFGCDPDTGKVKIGSSRVTFDEKTGEWKHSVSTREGSCGSPLVADSSDHQGLFLIGTHGAGMAGRAYNNIAQIVVPPHLPHGFKQVSTALKKQGRYYSTFQYQGKYVVGRQPLKDGLNYTMPIKNPFVRNHPKPQWVVVKPTKETVWKAIYKRDFLPVRNFQDHPQFKRAMDLVEGMLRRYLDDGRNPISSYDEISEYMRMQKTFDKATGLTDRLNGFKTKGDWMESPLFDEYLRAAPEIDVFWREVPKIELLPKCKVVNEQKQRTFQIPDFCHSYIGMRFFLKQNIRMKSVRWSAYGFNPFGRSFREWVKFMDSFPFCFMYDVKGWDRLFPLMIEVLDLRFRLLQKYMTPLDLVYWDWYKNQLLSPRCELPNGDIVLMFGLNPSGQDSTTVTNIIGHMILVALYLLHLNPDVADEVIEGQGINIFGDDGAHGIDNDIFPVTQESFVSFVKDYFGWTVTDFKTSSRLTDSDLTFLGFSVKTFKVFGVETVFPMWSEDRTRFSFYYSEDNKDLEQWLQSMYSSIVMSYPSPLYYELSELYRSVLEHINKTDLNSCEFFFVDYGVPQERELNAFYLGLESSLPDILHINKWCGFDFFPVDGGMDQKFIEMYGKKKTNTSNRAPQGKEKSRASPGSARVQQSVDRLSKISETLRAYAEKSPISGKFSAERRRNDGQGDSKITRVGPRGRKFFSERPEGRGLNRSRNSTNSSRSVGSNIVSSGKKGNNVIRYVNNGVSQEIVGPGATAYNYQNAHDVTLRDAYNGSYHPAQETRIRHCGSIGEFKKASKEMFHSSHQSDNRRALKGRNFEAPLAFGSQFSGDAFAVHENVKNGIKKMEFSVSDFIGAVKIDENNYTEGHRLLVVPEGPQFIVGSRAAVLSREYQEYSLESLTYRFIPAVGADFPGMLMMYYTHNVSETCQETGEEEIRRAASHGGDFVGGSVWEDLVLNVNPETFSNRLFTGLASDYSLQSAGVLTVVAGTNFTQPGAGETQSIGLLIRQARYKMYLPSLDSPLQGQGLFEIQLDWTTASVNAGSPIVWNFETAAAGKVTANSPVTIPESSHALYTGVIYDATASAGSLSWYTQTQGTETSPYGFSTGMGLFFRGFAEDGLIKMVAFQSLADCSSPSLTTLDVFGEGQLVYGDTSTVTATVKVRVFSIDESDYT